MARDFNREPKNHEPTFSCQFCTNRNMGTRHRHWLSYDGDLAQHLRESLPLLADGKTIDDARIIGILHWVHSMRDRYGGMVDERGAHLSAWDARRVQLAQYEKTYSSLPAPRTPVGRKVTFRSFVHLLTAANTAHATGWLDMLAGQFDEVTIGDEGSWTDFRRFVAEYEHSAQDPDNAHFLERIPTQPVVAMAGGGR
jgi:hypothetical protein